MKTSTKILLGFFLLVFLVPVFALISFSATIKRRQFTIVETDGMRENFRKGTFRNYKVIKLIGNSGRNLKCHFTYSDSMSYSYDITMFRDSINVFNVADTLFVQYVRVGDGKANNDFANNEVNVDIRLPYIGQVIVNNAEASIEPALATSKADLSVELYGAALFNLGTVKSDERIDTTAIPPTLSFEQLSVRSDNAELAVGPNVSIGQLNLHANGGSQVTIYEGATITNVQGELSDSSRVNASWKYVRQLAALTRQ